LSKRLSSWWTKAIPAAMASATLKAPRSRPPTRIAPALGATTPPRTFISVDLPAPFSPISPRTSPGATERLTFERATTPGYAFEMPISSRMGSGMGIRRL
jgi:hypothetical protein